MGVEHAPVVTDPSLVATAKALAHSASKANTGNRAAWYGAIIHVWCVMWRVGGRWLNLHNSSVGRKDAPVARRESNKRLGPSGRVVSNLGCVNFVFSPWVAGCCWHPVPSSESAECAAAALCALQG